MILIETSDGIFNVGIILMFVVGLVLLYHFGNKA